MCRGQPWPRATFPIIYFLKGCKFIQESKKQELYFFYSPNGLNAKIQPKKEDRRVSSNLSQGKLLKYNVYLPGKPLKENNYQFGKNFMDFQICSQEAFEKIALELKPINKISHRINTLILEGLFSLGFNAPVSFALRLSTLIFSRHTHELLLSLSLSPHNLEHFIIANL